MTQNTYDEWFNTELSKFGEWGWTVNDAGKQVDAILKDIKGCEEVVIKRIIDFFDKIDAPILKEGNVQKLFEAGFNTIESIIKATQNELVEVIGENGNKAFVGLHEKLTDIPLYKIMGAYSNQRGIGVRRMKKLQNTLGRDGMYKCNDIDVIIGVEGFDVKTAEQTVKVISRFIDFFATVQEFVIIAEEEKVGTSLSSMQVCFTGIRDKELVTKIESLGGKVTSSISGKTTIVVAKDPNSNTGKPKKARDMGITIMGIDEFKTMIEEE